MKLLVHVLLPRWIRSRTAPFAMALLALGVLAMIASCTPTMTVGALMPAATAPSQAAPESVHGSVRPEEGMASWYGPGFVGRLTASGEVFDTNELTAAHKTLPFGTRVRVTSVRNGRSVVVRINDRGPFKPGRIIDLSRAAAEAIGMVSSGVARVTVVPVTGSAGAVRAGVRTTLNTYEVISSSYPVGTLLVLSGVERSDRLVVRVVANGPEANGDVTLQVSEELFAVIGPAVVIETE